MKEKEFNLSKKIVSDYGSRHLKAIYIEDVKEFIKRLKEKFKEFPYNKDWNMRFNEIIDKLAGEELR